PQRDVAVWRWELTGEAFGDSAPNQDPDGDASEFVFDMRFPGQRYDAATGLNYNYFRDGYEAATGRYSQPDPIGLRGGISVYGYVSNKPLTKFDPKGLLAFGPTCSNAQRIFISNEIVKLANDIKENAKPNCENGDCDLRAAADAMRFLAGATFSCDYTVPCGVTTQPNFIYLYPPYIGAPDPEGLTNPDTGCGCFRGALFHEAMHHALGWSTPENTVRRETRKCVSCAGNKTATGGPL
ncbi:MAG: RHS repeat-associated core domain-containing protein, partial [Lysobacter sp.]|nr:RHS repeat-associated core domain-containing protein [Lysobacter sp.]